MHDDLYTDLAGATFIAAVDAAFKKVALVRPATRLCAFADPTSSQVSDVVVWRSGSTIFAFTRSSATGGVTLEIGESEIFVDESGPVPSVEVEDAAPGWSLLRSAGLTPACSFETAIVELGGLLADRFEAVFSGQGSVVARYREEVAQEALADLARAEAIEQAALVHEEWVSGIRVRELTRTVALTTLLDDAMPEPPPSRVWTVALPIGFIVCATHEQAIGFAKSWDAPNLD